MRHRSRIVETRILHARRSRNCAAGYACKADCSRSSNGAGDCGTRRLSCWGRDRAGGCPSAGGYPHFSYFRIWRGTNGHAHCCSSRDCARTLLTCGLESRNGGITICNEQLLAPAAVSRTEQVAADACSESKHDSDYDSKAQKNHDLGGCQQATVHGARP